MKKKIVSVLIIFAAFFFLLPNKTRAASCASLGGECRNVCSGTAINGDCGLLQVCCSDILCTPTGGTTDSGISTAIGCVPVLNNDNGVSLMTFILKWAVGIGGGIAFLLVLYGGFMVMSSAGNPERLKAGQELLTSAISGLILLIFSVFILKFIGIDILGLGAFGFGK
jgi:hypothetical protein